MRICTIGGTRFSGRAFTGLALEQARGRPSIGVAAGAAARGSARCGARPRGPRRWSRRPVARLVRRGGRLLRLRPGGRREAIASPGAGATSSSHRCPRTRGVRRRHRGRRRLRPAVPRRRRMTWDVRAAEGRVRVRGARRSATPGTIATALHRRPGTTRPTASLPGCVAPHPVGDPRAYACGRTAPVIDARATSRRSSCTCTSDVAGTFNIATPATPLAPGARRDLGRRGGVPLDVAWCDDAFVREHGLVVTRRIRSPTSPTSRTGTCSTRRAVAAGLTFRPLAETVADTLADRDRG